MENSMKTISLKEYIEMPKIVKVKKGMTLQHYVTECDCGHCHIINEADESPCSSCGNNVDTTGMAKGATKDCPSGGGIRPTT